MLAQAMKMTGSRLGPLAVAALLAVSSAQAVPVTYNLCASTGTTTPSTVTGEIIPIWGFSLDGNPGNPGGCAAAQLPGPILDVNAGDVVTVNLDNQLAENVSILFPGQTLIPDTSGAAPGGSTSYVFTATNPGTYLYESGTNTGKQIPMGLYGALIVRPATTGQAYNDVSTAYDVESTLVLSEIDPALNANPGTFDLLSYYPTYWLINGKAYPDTAVINAAAGQKVLLRYLNAGSHHHTMSLLGTQQRVIAKDAYPLTHPYDLVAETVASGQTVDAIATPSLAATAGTRYPLFNSQMHLSSGELISPAQVHPVGGMLTFIELSAGGPPPTGPIAVNDAYYVGNFGSTLNVAAPGVLGNDTNAANTAAVVSPPASSSAFTLNADGSFDYTHNGNAAVSDSFSYNFTNGGTSNTATVSLAINQAPSIVSVPVTAAQAGQAYSYDVYATDPNAADVLMYAVDAPVPAGMTWNPLTGLINWTPSDAQVGNHNVTARVTDSGGLFNTQVFVIAVAPPNGVHIGNLTGSSANISGNRWRATVTVTVHNQGEAAAANATVHGTWSAGDTNGRTLSCVTNGSGQCNVTSGRIRNNVADVTFTVTNVVHLLPYKPAYNHDPAPTGAVTVSQP